MSTSTTSIARVRATVTTSRIQDITLEYDARANKLRISDGEGHRLALCTNEAVYKVAAAAPAGHVIIRDTKTLPDLARTLERQGAVEIVDVIHDNITRSYYSVVKVLIPSPRDLPPEATSYAPADELAQIEAQAQVHRPYVDAVRAFSFNS